MPGSALCVVEPPVVNPVSEWSKGLSRMEVPDTPCQIVIWLLHHPTPFKKFHTLSHDASLLKAFHGPPSLLLSPLPLRSHTGPLSIRTCEASSLMAGLCRCCSTYLDVHRTHLSFVSGLSSKAAF